jgi:hypothetical protein
MKQLAHRWLRSFSTRYQYDTTYMENLLDTNLGAFLKFSTINLLSSHRRDIPLAPWCAAGIRAAMSQDCGPCVQLVCSMALEAGVDASVIEAVVGSDLAALDEEVALAFRFSEAVLVRDEAADELREQVRRRWGEDGLISLAMTINATRVYPGVKYALGYGQECGRVKVARNSVVPVKFDFFTSANSATVG